MPAYRAHVKANLFLGLPLSLLGLHHWIDCESIDLLSFAGSFAYGTFFLHPDLDLARQVRLFSLKGLLTLPFRPYSYLFKHRGISHVPFVGTATRILWLVALLWVVFTCLDWAIPELHFDQSYFQFVLAGVAIADLCHVLLDRIPTIHL